MKLKSPDIQPPRPLPPEQPVRLAGQDLGKEVTENLPHHNRGMNYVGYSRNPQGQRRPGKSGPGPLKPPGLVPLRPQLLCTPSSLTSLLPGVLRRGPHSLPQGLTLGPNSRFPREGPRGSTLPNQPGKHLARSSPKEKALTCSIAYFHGVNLPPPLISCYHCDGPARGGQQTCTVAHHIYVYASL